MIKFDKYSGKYFIELTPSNVVAFTFEQLSELAEKATALVQEETSRQLQAELDFGGTSGCDGGGCII